MRFFVKNCGFFVLFFFIFYVSQKATTLSISNSVKFFTLMGYEANYFCCQCCQCVANGTVGANGRCSLHVNNKVI